jgi:hypothetical protein
MNPMKKTSMSALLPSQIGQEGPCFSCHHLSGRACHIFVPETCTVEGVDPTLSIARDASQLPPSCTTANSAGSNLTPRSWLSWADAMHGAVSHGRGSGPLGSRSAAMTGTRSRNDRNARSCAWVCCGMVRRRFWRRCDGGYEHTAVGERIMIFEAGAPYMQPGSSALHERRPSE